MLAYNTMFPCVKLFVKLFYCHCHSLSLSLFIFGYQRILVCQKMLPCHTMWAILISLEFVHTDVCDLQPGMKDDTIL